METVVTAMASGSSSRFDFEVLCVTCGIGGYWTTRMWECDVCRDYFLCENCHKGSLEDSEVLSAFAGAHNRDHCMSSHVPTFHCDGCVSYPIWNRRWRCKVCDDFDLCETCYGGLDATDMPAGHSMEHPMIVFEVFNEEGHQFRPNFRKPVDSQWSYQAREKVSSCGFEWVKRRPLTEVSSASHMLMMESDAHIQASPQANDEKDSYFLQLEEQLNMDHGSSSMKHASETISSQQNHKIFLSHAGPEKDFVEQLNLDLSRIHHFGIFFDKDDESLPKGEPFPLRILDAAKHCELAIVVISDDYFVRKWPMLELVTFVKAQKVQSKLKILPIFYKLSVEDFKQPKRQQSYMKCWKQLLKGSSQIEDDIRQWKEALKVISRTNGIEYDKKMGEVTFRRKIVEIVCKQVKPNLEWDDSHVQGKVRLHELIYEKIKSSSNSSSSTLFMGLYGMGGSGKTTMCKVFGNQMLEQYLGRVCHIEFGNMDMVQLLKKLLQCICSLESSLLMMLDEGQAMNLLKRHISKQKVCLMIDNVLDDQASIEEARAFLNLSFMEGSVVLVTSRSRMILEMLKVEWGGLMKIPSLTMDEAKALFMYHTSCATSNLLEDQKKVMEKYLDQCNFKVEDMVSREYHPLALKVLGTQVGPNPKEWKNINIDFKYYENENKHHIFSILRLTYDTLIYQHKRMFLDIALSRRNYFEGIYVGGLKWQMRCLYGKRNDEFFLSLMKVLQAKSLVEFYDVKSDKIYIHDLYREFASMEVEKSEVKHTPSCCFSQASTWEHFVQEGRLRIHNQTISHIKKGVLSCRVCSRAELFSIQECPNLESIDVPNMRNLKVFEVLSGCPKLKSVDLEGALNLKCLFWGGFEGEYPNLTSLKSLEGLWIESYDAKSPLTIHGSLDFSRNSNLESLFLSNLPLNILNLNQAVLLKALMLDNCERLERLDGLEALVQLEKLRLAFCSSLVEFPSLANFPSLELFHLKGAKKLQQIHGFASLTSLRDLSLRDGRELEELPGIEACTRLSVLDLHGTSIRDCSWIPTMKDLMIINLSGTKIRFVPDCSGLSKLERLWLDHCQAPESIVDNKESIHPSFPKSLQLLSAWKCRILIAVPEFLVGSSLEYLYLNRTSVDDVSSVIHCQQLRELFCTETGITSLPDLSSLTRLEVVDVSGCKLLVRMDNTKSLPALNILNVSNCTRLSALPDLGSATGLKALSLRGCPLVDPNLVKLPSGSSTVEMKMEEAADKQSDEDDDAQECESQTSSPATDFQEPEPAHDLWRPARLLSWWQWIVSWCGGLDGN